MPRLAAAVVLALTAALSLAAPAGAQSGWHNCDAMILDGGRVEVVPSPFIVGGAPERGGFPRPTTAFFIQVRRGTCATARGLLHDLLASSDESIALGERGFGVRWVRDFPRVAGSPTYRVSTFRGRTLVRYVRFGRAPRLDHSIYRAGQWVDVYGAAVYGECTGAFVLKLASSPYPVGLTAGHCAELFNIGQPNPVQRAGAQLGAILAGSGENPDAAIFSLRSEWAVAQQIERGNRSPLTVAGSVPTRDQDPGERVCLAGRTSGADTCGTIVPNYPFANDTARCTNIKAGPGDSGGPIYTETRGLRTRAVGIAIEVGRYANRRRLCYEPIQGILEHFGAQLASGPLVRGPGIPS